MEPNKRLEYTQQKKLTPADELREILTNLERLHPKVKALDSTKALILLRDLDITCQLFEQLNNAELDLESERGRFREVRNQYRRVIGQVLKALGGPTALAEYRPKPTPPRERWWWYADEIVAARQQQVRKAIFTSVATVVLIIGAIWLAFKTVLAPDPLVVARYEAEQNSLDLAEQGNYQPALTAVETGLQKVPDSAELMLIKGGIYELLNRETEAQQFFEQAKTRLTPLPFYLGRAQFYLRTSQYAKMQADTEKVIQLDEKTAAAWLLLGQALEGQHKINEAINAYNQSAIFAADSDESEIVFAARSAVARLEALKLMPSP